MPMPAISPNEIQQIQDSGLFDPEWYAAQYPDLSLSGMDPFEHFLEVGLWIERDPGPRFDSVAYRIRNGLTDWNGVPLLHALQISLESTSYSAATYMSPGRCGPLLGYMDFPMEGDLVGHDYIRIIGWCYLRGEEVEEVRAEIAGSGKSTDLKTGIFRPDVAAVFPHLNFFDVGFEGEIYPSAGRGSSPELVVSARSRNGMLHKIRKTLQMDTSLTGAPANRNVAVSEIAQTLNGKGWE
jgi:hypothetical protein